VVYIKISENFPVMSKAAMNVTKADITGRIRNHPSQIHSRNNSQSNAIKFYVLSVIFILKEKYHCVVYRS